MVQFHEFVVNKFMIAGTAAYVLSGSISTGTPRGTWMGPLRKTRLPISSAIVVRPTFGKQTVSICPAFSGLESSRLWMKLMVNMNNLMAWLAGLSLEDCDILSTAPEPDVEDGYARPGLTHTCRSRSDSLLRVKS